MDLKIIYAHINEIDSKLCQLIEHMTEEEYNAFIESEEHLKRYDDLLTDYEDLESMPGDVVTFFSDETFGIINTIVTNKITELNI